MIVEKVGERLLADQKPGVRAVDLAHRLWKRQSDLRQPGQTRIFLHKGRFPCFAAPAIRLPPR